MHTRAAAKACAAELPVGLFLMDDLIIIEIIYYSFQIWKQCKAQNSPQTSACSYASTLYSSRGSEFRRARRAMSHSARHFGRDYSTSQLNQLTLNSLNYVSLASDDVVEACCAEDFASDVASIGDFPDD